MNVWSDQAEVGNAAISVFKILYGGSINETLTKLRYGKYLDMACKGIVTPEKLPPSERTSYSHGLHTHYQVLDWSLLGDDFELSALDWGWKKDNDILVPIMTDISIAPESLTKIIRCKCKVTTKNPCGTMICSCRKHGIPCLSSCGECRGVS